jgi:hypothetical protein
MLTRERQSAKVGSLAVISSMMSPASIHGETKHSLVFRLYTLKKESTCNSGSVWEDTQDWTGCRENHYHIKICCPLMYHKDSPQHLMMLKVSGAITQLKHCTIEHRQVKTEHFCSPLDWLRTRIMSSESLLKFGLEPIFPNIHRQ